MHGVYIAIIIIIIFSATVTVQGPIACLVIRTSDCPMECTAM